MEQTMSVRVALVLLAAAFLASTSTMVAVSARYLPTRSQEDRLERLRELLKDLFDSDYDHNRAYPDVPLIPERAAIYKRSAGIPYPAGATSHDFGHDIIPGNVALTAASGYPTSTAGRNGFMQLSPASYDSSFLAKADRKAM